MHSLIKLEAFSSGEDKIGYPSSLNAIVFNQRNYGWVVHIRTWWTQNQSKKKIRVWFKIKIECFLVWRISWRNKKYCSTAWTGQSNFNYLNENSVFLFATIGLMAVPLSLSRLVYLGFRSTFVWSAVRLMKLVLDSDGRSAFASSSEVRV
jgi:hypothetical protein